MNDPRLQVTPVPQVFQPFTVRGLYRDLLFAQAPLVLWALLVFGFPSLLTLSGAVLGIFLTDWIISRLSANARFIPLQPLTAGMSFALILPPAAGFFIPLTAGAAAVILAKRAFGGTSGHWLQVPIAAFLLVGVLGAGPLDRFVEPAEPPFGEGISTWLSPQPYTEPTNAQRLLEVSFDGATYRDPVSIIAENDASESYDRTLTEWLNGAVFRRFGSSLPAGYASAFVGTVPGMNGGVSVLLILLASVFLIDRKVIQPRIAFWYLAVYAAGIFVFGGLGHGDGFFAGDVVFHLFFGGPLFAAFFVLSQTELSPSSSSAQVFMAVGAAVLTLLFRFGGSAEYAALFGVSVTVILMPPVRRFLRPRRFGVRRKDGV